MKKKWKIYIEHGKNYLKSFLVLLCIKSRYQKYPKKSYRGSSIIGTSITVILAIPGFIKNSKLFSYLDFLLIIPDN